MTLAEPKRLLLVKLSSIGDVVQSLPVARSLRRRFPNAYLAWAVGPAAADVVAGHPDLDRVVIVGGAPGHEAEGLDVVPPLSAVGTLRRALRRYEFDTTLDLQGLFKSALVARLSGAPRRVGFRTLHEGTFLLNNRRLVPNRRDVHAVDSYLDFAEVFGASREPVEFRIAISETDREVVDELLAGHEELAALIPGARWDSKMWPAERFAAVADTVAERFGLTSVVTGASRDTELAARIASAARRPILDLTGRTTLKQAAELFRRCRVTIGNDTGPLYISSAVGTRTVALFGPSDAHRLGPYGEGHAKLVADVDCAPCRNRTCRTRTCMESITPEQVVEAAASLLADRQGVQ
ncbi:MAG: glycosyltransferase family 9 protein [Armatimonadetes bacterium]|nr:glycosyltransferase family 9 protein [Armatimonadota bacterium]